MHDWKNSSIEVPWGASIDFAGASIEAPPRLPLIFFLQTTQALKAFRQHAIDGGSWKVA